MENLPKAKVLFRQIIYSYSGYLTALDDHGQIWICNDMVKGEWERLPHPFVEIHPTPTPTPGAPVRRVA